jgi:ubiquinone/menaquinone biosynthesis methyltransferase
MSNKYYQPGEQRAQRVHDLFAAIAPRYDLINDLQSLGLHRWWKRRLVRLAHPQPGERAIDVCCGTGDIALALHARGATVIGLDFSDAMLTVAARRQRPETTGLEWRQGDALHLPFPDASFDLLTMGYGLRNVADFDAALAEIIRVLRPGGRCLILDFGKPDHPIWRACYYAYLRAIVPLFGRVLCGDPDTHGYIYQSLLRFPAQHGIAAGFKARGCTEVQIIPLLGGVMAINTARRAAD